MTAALTLMAKERGGPQLAAQVLFYPVTDADLDTETYQRYADGPWLTREAMRWFWDAYLPDERRRSEITASPLQATLDQLRGLPPALIINGEHDVLRAEGEAYARKLAQAGVPRDARPLQQHDPRLRAAEPDHHHARAARRDRPGRRLPQRRPHQLGATMPTDHHPRPRRVRRILELEPRRRDARLRRPSGHRLREPAADHRRRRRRTERARPNDRRSGPARRPLLRRGCDHRRRRRRRRDHRSRVRGRVRPPIGRKPRRRGRPRTRRDVGRDAPDRPIARRGVDTYIAPGKFHRPVLCGCTRTPSDADGDHPASDHRGGAHRARRGQPALGDHGQLVHLRQQRPQHPGRSTPDHGRARRRQAHRRGAGASHAVGVSRAAETAMLILDAARFRSPVQA